MDTITIALAAVGGAAVLVAALLVWRGRKTGHALDVALGKIGVERQRRTSRVDALAQGLDSLDRHITTAQRDRAQLVAAMGDAHIGILTVTDAGIVTFVNDAAHHFLGAKIGEQVAEARLKAVLDDVIVNRSITEQELELSGPMKRVLHLTVRPISLGVESLGAVLYIQDLSETRRVDAVRRDFVANVSHELKTPLGALSILAETIRETDDEAVRDKLAERLSSDASRMAGLVNDILELSRVESTGAPLHRVPLEILIPEAVGRVRFLAEEAGVDIMVGKLPQDTAVAGEKRQLVTAVTHMLENAIRFSQYSEEDASDKVWLRVQVDPNWVRVEVQDKGIGMPESHLGRIFERFYRIDRDRSSADTGSGLGLSIVRHVALNHGGEVAVSSEEGKGTTFTLRLPKWIE